MLSSAALVALAAVANGMPVAEPATATTTPTSLSGCKTLSFYLMSPQAPSWKEAPYCLTADAGTLGPNNTPLGLELWYNANSPATATHFTLDTSNGTLHNTPTMKAYYIGSIQGLGPEILFNTAQGIARVQSDVGSNVPIVSCKTPTANNTILTCDADGTGKVERWFTCYQNSQGISLGDGNPNGPYPSGTPPPQQGISCGSTEMLVTNLTCIKY